ncbi:MAG: sigma-70 family RNA polymerase sigma factor [Phycisphaerales bacterium]|nr:sigma-70 family RNA polymerase sigma factor [Phycisphaerales bacterium]
MIAVRSQLEATVSRADNLRRIQPAVGYPDESVLGGLSSTERKHLQQLVSRPYEYVWHPDFDDMSESSGLPVTHEHREGTPTPQLANAARHPGRGNTLTPEQERRHFIQFNYARYRIFCLLRRNCNRRLGLFAARALLHWARVAQEVRATIVNANTPLVVAFASRARTCGVELRERISDGNLALLSCVDKFDCSRGHKFSTYAGRAIFASFSRAIKNRTRHCAHYQTSRERTIHHRLCMDPREDFLENEDLQNLRRVLLENTADLSAVERCVLDARFSLNVYGTADPEEPRTLREVGRVLGVSKERVRQIQNRAIGKLRTMLECRQRVVSATA